VAKLRKARRVSIAGRSAGQLVVLRLPVTAETQTWGAMCFGSYGLRHCPQRAFGDLRNDSCSRLTGVVSANPARTRRKRQRPSQTPADLGADCVNTTTHILFQNGLPPPVCWMNTVAFPTSSGNQNDADALHRQAKRIDTTSSYFIASFCMLLISFTTHATQSPNLLRECNCRETH